jgi:hypothetical protein
LLLRRAVKERVSAALSTPSTPPRYALDAKEGGEER